MARLLTTVSRHSGARMPVGCSVRVRVRCGQCDGGRRRAGGCSSNTGQAGQHQFERHLRRTEGRDMRAPNGFDVEQRRMSRTVNGRSLPGPCVNHGTLASTIQALGCYSGIDEARCQWGPATGQRAVVHLRYTLRLARFEGAMRRPIASNHSIAFEWSRMPHRNEALAAAPSSVVRQLPQRRLTHESVESWARTDWGARSRASLRTREAPAFPSPRRSA
jgi:hypothetical protein